MERTQRDGLLFIALAVIGYSVLPIVSKLILDTGLQPLDVATWRFVIAAPAFWLLIVVSGVPKPSLPLPRVRLLAIGILLGLAALSVFYGLQRLPPGLYTVLFFTHPTMIALFAVLLGERLPGIMWVVLVLTLIGVVLTIPDPGAMLNDLSGDSAVGVLLALFNALVVSLYFILNERIVRVHTGVARVSAYTITGALLTILAADVLRGEVHPPSGEALIYLLILGIFCTVMPVFSFVSGIQRLGSPRASILGTVEPVLTLILSMMIFGERMAIIQFVGSGFIVGSVVLLQAWRYIRPAARIKMSASSG